jgi:hypothetical protein
MVKLPRLTLLHWLTTIVALQRLTLHLYFQPHDG